MGGTPSGHSDGERGGRDPDDEREEDGRQVPAGRDLAIDTVVPVGDEPEVIASPANRAAEKPATAAPVASSTRPTVVSATRHRTIDG